MKSKADIDLEIARLEKKLTNPKFSGVLREMNQKAVARRIASLKEWKQNWVRWHVQIWIASKLHALANRIWYSCED